jgi:hypothetical protein
MIRRTATTKKMDEDSKLYGDEDEQDDVPSMCKTAVGGQPGLATASDSNTRYTSNAAPSTSTAIQSNNTKFRVISNYESN